MGDRVLGMEARSVQDFTDLRVWQAAMNLADRLYRLTWKFPRNEMYGLAAQIQRACVSVPSNIAEGHTRESTKEYLNFVSMARGSLAELRTQILIAGRIGYLEKLDIEEAVAEIIALSRQLTALRNSLRVQP